MIDHGVGSDGCDVDRGGSGVGDDNDDNGNDDQDGDSSQMVI